MINKVFAEDFAADWIDSWNRHDLARILSHCTDDVEMSSPIINKIISERSDTLIGKKTLAVCCTKALQLFPNLHFELVTTLVGAHSVTLYCKGVRGLYAEVFHFNEKGKVTKTYAHYLTH